jgi:SAM-dependent methyltransferase
MTEPLSAIEANRLLYRDLAPSYDETEACVIDARQHARLVAALDEALAAAPADPRVLDACGGSGNVAALLARRGLAAAVVDVSAEMLARWEAKAQSLGIATEVHAAPIETFLDADDRAWDLIVFSSALHHLESPRAVLVAAAAQLAPGGVILTIYDPTRADRVLRAVRMVDWLGHLLLHRPREFAAVGRRTIARKRQDLGGDASAHVGRTAERHALAGIDDLALRRDLSAAGLEVLVHERLYEARLGVLRLLLRVMRRPSAFRLLLRRPLAGLA